MTIPNYLRLENAHGLHFHAHLCCYFYSLALPYFPVVTFLAFDQLEQYFFPFTDMYVLILT